MLYIFLLTVLLLSVVDGARFQAHDRVPIVANTGMLFILITILKYSIR